MSRKLLSETKALPEQYRAGTITKRLAEHPPGEWQCTCGARCAETLAACDACKSTRAAAAPTYECVVSTESEVERWFGVEILDHSPGAVDMARLASGAAVLVDHCGDQVGVVENARVDSDRKLRAELRFSSSARGQEVQRDVDESIRQNISVGYFVKKAELAEKRENDVQVWRVTRWQPAEVSIVSVPADLAAGFGRAVATGHEYPVEVTGGDAAEMERDMLQGIKFDQRGAGGGPAPAPTAAVVVESAEVREATRASEIRGLCTANKLEHLTRDYVASTMSVDEVAARLTQLRETPGSPVRPVDPLAAVPEKAMRKYSFHRLIQGLVRRAEGKGDVEGLEAEVAQELERSYPADFKRNGGVLAPMSKRATLTTTDPGKGVETVFEQQGGLIEVLRNRTRVLAAGAQMLTGLTGPVSFVKQTAGSTVVWVGENPAANVADTEPSFAISQLVPKTMQGNIPFTRQFLAQSSLDAEALTVNELGIGHGLALDYAALVGLAAAGEPPGLYAAAGVNSWDASSSFANVTVANLMANMVGAIADKNADVSTMRWLATPLLAAKLRATLEFSAAGSATIWQGTLQDGTMLGYGAACTSQLPKTMTGSERTGGSAHGLVFGNWQDYLLALFGTMEFVVDPYSLKKKGVIEVTSFQMGDTLARHGESFAKAVNLTLT